MAPIDINPRKRPTPSQSPEDTTEQHSSKKARTEPTLPYIDQELPTTNKKVTLFDDDPRQLLERSVALTLEHVGFEGASQEALEALCAEADTYATHFLSQITSSMLNARRSQPTPMDFKYALAQFSLPIASLEPHLKPPVSASKYHLQLEPQLPDELNAASVAVLLGKDLSGEPDKRTKPYIPKRFPSFPSKHTYKWSEKESTRETDPRKIREAASKEARQAEEGLRKFTQVNKGGREKELKKTASKDPTSKTRHELWEGTMGELEFTMNGLLPAAGGSDRGMIVNADSKYLRTGASAKKKSPTMHA